MLLLKPSIKDYILKKIKIYSIIVGCILLMIILKHISSNPQLILNLNFIGFSLLVWPPMIILTHISSHVRFKQWAHPFTKQELDAVALSMILPSLRSTYRDLSTYGKITTTIALSVIILPLMAQTIHISLWIALICYGFMLIRYIRCFYQVNNFKLSMPKISDDALIVPVLGFLNQYNFTLSFDDINKIVVLGSRENIQAIENETDEVNLFMLGVRIHYKTTKIFILSTAIVPFEFLYTLVDHVSNYHGKNFKPYIELISSSR